MFTICITHSNIGNKEWVETKHGWSLNEDYLKVIGSKFLNRTMICDNDGMAFIVCEKAVPLPPMTLRDLPEYMSAFATILEGDGVLIHLANSGRLSAIRTAHATVPIYVSGETHQFCAGWDFNSIVSQRQLVTLSRSELRRFIQNGPELSQETIASNIKQLLPGQKAIWSPGVAQIEISDGNYFNCFEQSALRAGATLSSVFIDLIKSSSAPALNQALIPAIELSGGMDSSCVAIALKNEHKSLQSYALIHRGNGGDQQQARRHELIQQLNFIDCQVDSTICKPFTSLERFPPDADFMISPYDELYWDGIVECINSMPNGKPDLVITGIGGDELTITSDYDDHTAPFCPKITQSLFFRNPFPTRRIPKTFVSQSALTAAFVRARMFLHHEIWPKNPLIDPRVVQFCQMIPPEHKKNRLLNKLTLARAGLSDYFITPRFKENFSRVFMDDLLDFRSDAYFSESLLHSHMIANAAVLANEIRNIQNGANADLSLYVIINAVRLEHILRYYSEKFSIRFCD